jgi:hypothetical protein
MPGGVLGSGLMDGKLGTLFARAGHRVWRTADARAAFGAPTVVHFGAALLLSAILRALVDNRPTRSSLGL